MTGCAECLAWGLTHARGVCLACYNFSAPGFGHRLGDCGACARRVPLKDGYCRLCWCEAREDRVDAAADARSAVVIAPHLPGVRCHQLFLAGMTRRRAAPRTTPRRPGAKGRPLKAPPTPTARPDRRWTQLTLFPDTALVRDYTAAAVDLRRGPAPDNPWLAWALHVAHTTAEARGWAPDTRRGMQRTLVTLLAGHHDSDRIRATDVRIVASGHSVNVDYAAEILDVMGVLAEDRPHVFDTWLAVKLDGMTLAIGREVGRWAHVLHDGGPRTLPRKPDTIRTYLRVMRPALLDWSSRYDHLREVTRDDVLAYLRRLRGEPRSSAATALRSLFSWARRSGVIFRNPATRITTGRREHVLWQPLSSEDITEAVAMATTPQARVLIAMAAVHAARPHQIRAMRLHDVDLADRHLTIGGRRRPLDHLTHTVLRDWLTHRAQRWPATANPHLLISKESALRYGPVSAVWMRELRGLTANLERLRIDRQLEEAMTTGPDPLHLAMLFGISETTAIRYANNARQLLETPHEATASTSPGTRASVWHADRNRPLGSR
ncbi:integrase [Actinokineospora auranticolor]|uniref:integrase n=1 Tax=Actinokineospora auranticolor TaxID=155976 RepID=UPI001CA5AF2C|nr:integrase [Actinokineospora auranticolor]